MKILSYFLIFVLLIFGITFAIINADLVTLHYYLGTRDLPLSLLIAYSFGAGALVGILFGLGVTIRKQSQIRSLKRKITTLETEVTNLRTIPIKDTP